MCKITLPTGKLQWEDVFSRTCCAAAAELTAYCAQGSGRFLYAPDEIRSFVTGCISGIKKNSTEGQIVEIWHKECLTSLLCDCEAECNAHV